MFDKLEDLLIRYEELMSELSEPDVANNPERFRKLMKEQSDILPIVEAYKEYKQCKQNIEDSLAMLEEESDEEMRELAKEELNDAKNRVAELENELKILLLPKAPAPPKTRTMTKTLSWRSVPVPVEMRRHYLRQRFTVCISIMQRQRTGKQRSWNVTTPESAA